MMTAMDAARAYDAEGARLGRALNFPEEWVGVEDIEEEDGDDDDIEEEAELQCGLFHTSLVLLSYFLFPVKFSWGFLLMGFCCFFFFLFRVGCLYVKDEPPFPNRAI